MIAVITAVFVMLLVFLLKRLITDQLPVAVVFGNISAGSMALYGFIVGKRMQLADHHYSAGINSIGYEYCQQQKYKTA